MQSLKKFKVKVMDHNDNLNIKILKAHKEDLNQILELNLQLFKFEKQFSDKYSLDWTFSELGRNYFLSNIKRGMVYLAKDKKIVVGYICGVIYTNSARKKSKIAEIDNMLIIENYRNRGIGSKLIDSFVNKLKKMGVQTLRVGALIANSDATAFYKNNGFLEHEVFLEKTIEE